MGSETKECWVTVFLFVDESSFISSLPVGVTELALRYLFHSARVLSTMWYQFWPPSTRAIHAVLAMWRWWLIIFVIVAVIHTMPLGQQKVHDLGEVPVYGTTFTVSLSSFPPSVSVSSVMAVLLTTCVFLWMGFSRGLPHHLRVFGKFEDPNPWLYDNDAAAFAEELVTTDGEVDDDTGVEIVRVTGNIIEPGEPGMLFFCRPIRRTWDNLWNALLGRPCKRGVIVGNARTGKSYSLMYVLRKALKDERVVVLELRKDAKAVYLFEPSGRGCSSRCRAWRVRKSRWQDDGCAVLKNPNSVFLVDVDRHDDQSPLRPRGMAFMASSLHPDHYKEWIKGPGGGGTEAAVGTANLGEITLMCTTLGALTPEQAERRYAICGGRLGTIMTMDAKKALSQMTRALEKLPLSKVRRIAGPGTLDGPNDAVIDGHSTLVSCEPDVESEQLGEITLDTKLCAASPFALQLLTLRYLHQLYAEVMDVHSVAMHGAGRLFERYMRCLVGMGGTFRVRRLDSPEEERLTLPPATIRASPAGAGSTQAFRDNWAALTSKAEPHAAVEESPPVGLSIDNALVGSPASVRVLRHEDLPRLLPHYAVDYGSDGDDADRGRVLLMPLSSVDNVPCVDAADAKNRAYQVTVSRLPQKKLSFRQLKLHLDAIGATAADRLQLYYFVPAAYFDEVKEAVLKRVTLKGASGRQAMALRRRYDEYLMAVDCEDKAPFVEAARRTWSQT